MKLKKYFLPAVKAQLWLIALLALALVNSCNKLKFTPPINVGTIRFANSTYSINLNAGDPLNVVVPLSLPLEQDATAIINIDAAKSTALSSQYTIDPVIPAGGLKLSLAKGATQVSFNVASLDNFEGDATLVLTLSSATGGVTISNTNATTTITIHGKPIVLPAITTSVPGLDNYGAVNVTTTSASKSFTVSGTKLTSNVSVVASDNFKVSLDNVTFTTSVSLGFAAVMASPVTVYVQFAPNSGTNQAINGTITLTSGSVPSASVTVSGTETGNAQIGTLLIKDDFNYGATAGALTTASASVWAAYSAAGANAVQYSGTGLSFPGYVGSGIGGCAISENKSTSAEDDNLIFASQTAGTVYVAQLLNLVSAPAVADFFTSLGDAPASPTFHNRIYAKANGSQYQLALSRNSTTTPIYASANLDYGTTYLVVYKYDFSSGTGLSAMYILSGSIPTIEPAVADVTSSGGADAGAITKVIIRQSTALPLKANIDGVRVATSWKQAVGK